jgi:hypothetical protein
VTAGGPGPAGEPSPPGGRVPLRTIAREWGRIGCIGFGGPPAHIALLRTLAYRGAVAAALAGPLVVVTLAGLG